MDKGLDLFSAFATDETKENEGVDVPVGGGTVLKIARAGNPKFEKMLLEELEKHQIELETLPEVEAKELDTRIYRKVVSHTILIGWTKARYKDKPLAYTPGNAEMLLVMTDFRKLVMGHASSIELFRVKSEVQDTKN